MAQTSDTDFLRLEIGSLWGSDAYSRLEPHPLAVAGVAKDGQVILFSPALDRDRVQPFKAEASQVIQSTATPDHAPPVLLQLAELLPAPTRPIEVVGGPSYVFESVSPEASLCSAELVVFTSEGDVSSTLATARPEAWWKTGEWADLLAGRLGPWAIGMAAGRVASLCHTPVASVRAAEAGVWTHPDVRGRGYASIVTRAWATVASTEFQNLFYSTSASNTASRRVAEKMQQRPIGWIWQLRTATNATA